MKATSSAVSSIQFVHHECTSHCVEHGDSKDLGQFLQGPSTREKCWKLLHYSLEFNASAKVNILEGVSLRNLPDTEADATRWMTARIRRFYR